MSEELIRKSEVLELLENINTFGADCIYACEEEFRISACTAVENLQPVNSVELPCKVGDKIYTVYFHTIKEHQVGFFEIDKDNEVFIVADIDTYDTDGCKSPLYIGLYELGSLAFLTREKAERALEELNG